MMRVVKWVGLGLLCLIVLGAIIAAIVLRTPAPPKIDKAAILATAKTYDARILRDNYGVPHIHGKADADASFGFGYAHAEDDWETIQTTLIAARGRSSEYFGQEVAPPDYLFDLFKVTEAVESKFSTLSPQTQSVAKAYADAINLWGVENPDRVLPGVLPVTAYDVVAGFTWATPFFYRLDLRLEDLFTAENKPNVSPWREITLNLPSLTQAATVRGSNAFAVAPARSTDGHTRLVGNSHQPMTGPYAWYEAHMISDEGMNITGGTFPGVPIISQGVTPDLAWTHTVNMPDLLDIYALDVDDQDDPQRYKMDGEWRDFMRSKSKFRVKLWRGFSLPVTRDVLWSDHGPVLSTPTGHYAIRFAGLQEVGALEQWYEMGKATNMAEWKATLAKNGVLSFNIVYADKDGNIAHVYNAKMPKRIEGPDWTGVLPGDRSELTWNEYADPRDLPQIWNPDCGWVFSANATPFQVTDPGCDLSRENFSKTFGIETRMTNRAKRSIAQLSKDEAISREELLAYRADATYAPDSTLMKFVVELVSTQSDDPLIQQAQEILRNWDGSTERDSRGAALAVISGTRALGYQYDETLQPPMDALLQTAKDLQTRFDRLDPEWGEVNRIQRGDIDVSINGAPDVLRAIYADRDGVAKTGVMNAFAGDTHIFIADWNPDGELRLDTIHQYGAATLNESSPHYADQVEMFARGEYKPMPVTLDEVLAVAVRDYRPGQ
ncbi:penicillin acylase family protein [Litorimonas sp. RW-G-Af-16]|uniref:penicillin acylase family protein n=1 Tax=Litorimonas sp. RW-G-Af-16 TaxID=3241168 RepID=UPI00390C66A8